MRSDCDGNLLKRLRGTGGRGSLKRGCRNVYTPSKTATTWKGVTYRTIAATKQKNINIAVALHISKKQDIKLEPHPWMRATSQQDRELVRALETHPKAVPWEFEIQLSMVMGLQVLCRDRALKQMKGYHPNYVSPSTKYILMNQGL